MAQISTKQNENWQNRILISCTWVIVGALVWLPEIVRGQDESIATANRLDERVRALLREHQVEAIDKPAQRRKLVALGQALFFDRILSGNKDIACATCHHPLLATGDALALSVGTGATPLGAVGSFREMGAGREFVPRNAPEIFNRGSMHWRSQFWDSRIEKTTRKFDTPAGAILPRGFRNVLEAQAMFPVTSRDEMRGSLEDALDSRNELAALGNTPDDFPAIWDALMARLEEIQGYRIMFEAAFKKPIGQLGFQHAARAIAAFEAEAFGYDDSPFDNYLRGDNSALRPKEKRGAILFFGKANCAECHTGTLLTDQEHYNIGVPQLGPGKAPFPGLDVGRFTETLDPQDRYRFRTPPLRNVTETGPWMHNGAFNSLEDAVRHHLNPVRSLLHYAPDTQLDQVELRDTVITDRKVLRELVQGLDIDRVVLTNREFQDLMAFLESLTVPNLESRLLQTIPDSVPSGLLEDGIPDELPPPGVFVD